MHSTLSKATLFIGAVLVSMSIAATTSPAYASINVAVDGDSYLVTGGVFHHEIYPGDREEAAHCIRCYWKISVICQSWDEAHQSCPYLRLKCPATMRLAEVRRAEATSRPPSDSPLWNWQGYTCLDDGGPASERDINSALASSWRVLVPTLSAVTVPRLSTLVNFPTRVRVTSATTIPTMRNYVAQANVTIRAIATASLSCDTACTSSSGYVTFHSRGFHQLKTTVTWRGFYSVDGFAESEIGALPIIQRKTFTLPVYALHRKLIPTQKERA